MKRLGVAVVVLAALGCSDRSSPPAGSGGALRAREIAARQAEGALDRRYHLSGATKLVRGQNPAHDVTLAFTGQGAELRARAGWVLGVEATGVTCGATIVPLRAALPDVSEPNRVEYRREAGDAPFVEWYVNGPLGLEQGFTLERSPCPAGVTAFGVQVEFDGLRAELDGERVGLRDARGNLAAYYSDWFGVDALGNALPVALHVASGGVRLDVDVSGARWPIVLDPLLWLEQQRLTPLDGAVDDYFGYAVALSDDTALVGALGDDDKGSGSGSAYVFTSSGATWSQQQKLTAGDGLTGDGFGYSAWLSGDTALIGAPFDDAYSGSAYVFTRSGTTWSQQQKLTAANRVSGQFFGYSVSGSSDTALVGAESDSEHGTEAGAAYVFSRTGTTWTQEQKLTASDAATGDNLGTAVAASGNTALLGSPHDDDKGSASGSAYVFTRTGTVWTEEQKLTASDTVSNDRLGSALSLAGDTALVAAPLDDDHGGESGSAYVFTRTGTVWTEEQKLTAADAAADDFFGDAVSLAGDTALIGADGNDDKGSFSGSAYVFTRTGTVWTEEQKLTADAGAGGDNLGEAVAVSAQIALVGAIEDTKTNGKGAAYVWRFGPENGSACNLDTECASRHCVENVCCDEACDDTCLTCLAARQASGVDGVCGDVVEGTDPRDHCDAQAASTCGTTGVCDGAGTCTLYTAGTECAAASCPTTTSENHADTCDGSGTCDVTSEAACGLGYACVSGACKTSCSASGDCHGAAGYDCIGGECKIPLGGACSPTDVCETGLCIDAVCCETACDGVCEACAATLTGAADGECEPIPAGDDPENECEKGASCLADGQCNGAGQCREFTAAGTQCGGTECDGSTLTARICDGGGECQGAVVQCAPFVCGGSACKESCADDADCEASAYCDGADCAPKRPDGADCEAARECDSGHCSDGVCCNAACAGQCEACKQPGAEGKCVAVLGAPVGDRLACAASDDEPCQARFCDGEDGEVCAGFPSVDVTCRPATCDADGQAPAAVCDGRGECALPEPVSCGAYRCNAEGTRCTSSCTSDADCVDGARCADGECSDAAECSADGAALIGRDREEVPCAPYKCKDGACQGQCSSTSECSSGYVCNPENERCELAESAPAGDSGCGCRVAGGDESGRSLVPLLAGAALSVLYRRRRGKHGAAGA